MRVVYEKKFILDVYEKEVVNSFLQTLAMAPLPCQGCKAQAYGKCISHSIWDDLSLNETCTEYIKWREKIRGIRSKFDRLEDEELKKIIENKYILNYTLQNVDKASVLHKIAENKEKKTSNIPKIDVDYSYHSKDYFILEPQEKEEVEDAENCAFVQGEADSEDV